MAKSKPQKRASLKRAQKRSEAGFVPILVTTLIVIVAGVSILLAVSGGLPGSGPQPVMTLEPEIVLNLTRLPQATPLSGEAAAEWNEFRAAVDACGDYRPERRQQMHQHIDWLLDPSDIPGDVIIALGPDPTAKLIFAMATYTSSEWRLGGRKPDSCLVPIGRLLNDRLVAAGEEPFDTYDETTAQ